MLTPAQLQGLSDVIEEVYIHIVDELLVNIGKHIRSPNWTHTAKYEVQKLSELGQLTKENAAIINKWIKTLPEAVRSTMEESRQIALAKLEKQLEKAAAEGFIAPPAADSTMQILEDYASQALEKYNLVNTTMLQSSVDMYTQAIFDTARSIFEMESRQKALMQGAEAVQGILNTAAGKVATGAETRTEAVKTAIKQTLKQLSDDGLTGFVDRSGRNWTPEAYVNMVTRTTVHNVAIESTKARMQDWNTEVFQMSSHEGARPLCYPYQGGFYSWDNTEGDIELGNGETVHYLPINSTSYGEPAGVFGINCGHYPIPVVPGVSIPHGADNIEPKAQNDKDYAESQQQRALERQIREAKRVVEMEGPLASKEDKDRVKDLQAQMRDFINETGRTRRYDREQVVTS